jgi:hypothetical protein
LKPNVGGDAVEGVRNTEPAFPGMPSCVGRLQKPGGVVGLVVSGCVAGQCTENDLAVMASDGAGGGDPA